MLVVVFLLDQPCLQLMSANPGEETQLEFAALEYHVLEVEPHLVHDVLGVGLHLVELRTLHINIL